MATTFIPPKQLLVNLDQLEFNLKNGRDVLFEKFQVLKQMIQLQTELKIADSKKKRNIDINCEEELPESLCNEINILNRHNEKLIKISTKFEQELVQLYEKCFTNSFNLVDEIANCKINLDAFISSWDGTDKFIEANKQYLMIRSYLNKISEYKKRVDQIEAEIKKIVFNDFIIKYEIIEENLIENPIGTIQMVKTADVILLDIKQILTDNNFVGKIYYKQIQLQSNGLYLIPFSYIESKNTLVILLNPTNNKIERIRTFENSSTVAIKTTNEKTIIFCQTKYSNVSFKWTTYVFDENMNRVNKNKLTQRNRSENWVKFITANKNNIYLKIGNVTYKYDYEFKQSIIDFKIGKRFLEDAENTNGKWILKEDDLINRKKILVYNDLKSTFICSLRSDIVNSSLKISNSYLINLSNDLTNIKFYDIDYKLELRKKIQLRLNDIKIENKTNFNYFITQKNEIIFVK